MNEILLVYGSNCIDSINAINLVDDFIKGNKNFIVNKVPFSFESEVVKNFKINFTPTFIINNEIKFIGTPNKEEFFEAVCPII